MAKIRKYFFFRVFIFAKKVIFPQFPKFLDFCFLQVFGLKKKVDIQNKTTDGFYGFVRIVWMVLNFLKQIFGFFLIKKIMKVTTKS